MTKPLADRWEHACSLACNMRLAAQRCSAPDQTKELGGSGSTPGVMPAPTMSETMRSKQPEAGTEIAIGAGSQTAQHPDPAE
jgi:hypothetical protein